jgi:hypothetical protein
VCVCVCVFVCVCVCVCKLQVSVAVLLDNFVSETSREKNAQHDLLVEEMNKLQKSTPHSGVDCYIATMW